MNLLISLKPNIKPGRRPKDLEKDYEAERIRKAALEDKATCGICHNYWELVDYHGKQNIIADHGFNITFGYRAMVLALVLDLSLGKNLPSLKLNI